VPWCDDCAKFWSPASLSEGACPTCGHRLAVPSSRAGAAAPPDASGPTQASSPGPAVPGAGPREGPSGEQLDHPKAPWHFKLLLVALVIYLSYRAYQGVWWVGHSWLHLF
jgi:hypothetical protein